MLDWQEDLRKKFQDDPRINKLKEEGFYGYVQINFHSGNIIELNKYQTVRPISK